ncbi:hypothetical protein CANINC_003714, partial [Pichia inconspicua]
MLFNKVSLLSALFGTATAIDWTSFQGAKGAPEFWTCDTSLLTLKFDYTPLGLGEYAAFYDHFCDYPPAVNALLLCAHEMAEDKSDKFMESVFKIQAEACDEHSSFHHPWTFYRDQYKNATANNVPLESVNTSLPV